MRHILALSLFVLSLPASAAITGILMTRDGQPVAGARVLVHATETPEARRVRWLSQAPELVAITETKSDAKGAFSIPSPKEPVVDLRVEMRGYEPMSRRVAADEEVGAIALTSRSHVQGKITAAGKPVANALVAVSYGPEYLTRTDEQGRYEVPELRRATSITVIHPDYAIDDENFPIGAAKAAGELNRTLSPGTALSGRTVAANGTTAIADAVIYVDGWPLATSDAEGAFTIARAPQKWTMLAARRDALYGQRASATDNQALVVRLERSAVLSGRVRDAKTKMPIPGAMVRLIVPRAPARGDLLPTVLTDAKGTYSITTPAGSYMLTAQHPAYQVQTVDASLTSGQELVKDINVTQHARVTGVIVDEEKRPVAGATVSAEDVAADMMRMPARFMRDTNVSGPDGRFSLTVQPDSEFRVRAVKKGMPQVQGDSMKVAAGDRKGPVVLTIPAGVAVSGRVLDANGDPLSGVSVSATETPAGGDAMVRRMIFSGPPGQEEDLIRTASDGTFTVRVKEGTYDFTFKREGFAQKQVRAQSITPNGQNVIETRLDPAVEISGRVTRGGAGVPDVTISAFSVGGSTVVTGPDGSFTMAGLTPGLIRVMLRKDADLLSEQRSLTAPGRDIVVELPQGGTVTGRVVEKGTKRPITSFQAGVSTSRGGGGMVMMAPPLLRSFTSDDGSFKLEHVPPGSTFIVASAPGYTTGRMTVDVQDGKAINDLVLELETGVRLTGKVTGANGAPLSDASVMIQPSATGGFAMRGAMSRATTDANGEYTLDSLEVGEETVSISHPKHVEVSRKVTLKGKETRLDVQLTAGERLTGTVVTEGGMPVADAYVRATTPGDMREARTNASGIFELEAAKPGRYRFSASKSGYADGILEDVDITSGTPVRIQLKSGGTIYGQVTGLSEAELSSTTVWSSASGRAGGSASAPVDPQGNYRIEGVPVGSVRVSASTNTSTGGGKSSPQQIVEVAAGSAQQVNINFSGDTLIRGRVTRNGVPFTGAQVFFAPKQGGASANATVDEQGSYSVSGLEPGDYTIMIRDFQRGSSHTTTYTVRGSATFDIDYKTASVRGRVLDAASNEPVSSANVQLRPVSSGPPFGMSGQGSSTDPSGAFVIDNVAAGSYSITVSAEGFANHVGDLTLGDSGRDDLQFHLSKADGVTVRFVDARDGRVMNGQVWAFDPAGRLVHDPRSAMRFGSSTPDDLKVPLPPGRYTLTVMAQGYAPRVVSATSPSPLTVALTPGGTIRVQSKHAERRRFRILDASGMVYPRTEERPMPINLFPGTTPFDRIAPGTYTLQLLNDNDTVADTMQITVREGETVDVSI